MLTIKPATLSDETRLLEWRNDEQTRAASFTTELVSPDAHRAWLGRKLADPDCLLLIAENDGDPVGTVRLDLTGDTAEISITIAPEHRAKGLSEEAMRLALAELGSTVTSVRAEVKTDNLASLRMVAAVGFIETGREGDTVTLIYRP